MKRRKESSNDEREECVADDANALRERAVQKLVIHPIHLVIIQVEVGGLTYSHPTT
jgi:hypothetical protein